MVSVFHPRTQVPKARLPDMTRGLFITFEGGEGAGKTTQIKKLAQFLENCVLTREPGGTSEAEAMRDLFVAHKGQNWPVEAQLLLMCAARAHHTQTVILPALESGKTVICDRYADSTRVYQGYAGGVSLDDIERVNTVATKSLEPDITFILDIPPQEGLKRAGRRSADDSFESKTIDFHERLRQGYLDIAAKNPNRCVVIDATQPMDVITRLIQEQVKRHVR